MDYSNASLPLLKRDSLRGHALATPVLHTIAAPADSRQARRACRLRDGAGQRGSNDRAISPIPPTSNTRMIRVLNKLVGLKKIVRLARTPAPMIARPPTTSSQPKMPRPL